MTAGDRPRRHLGVEQDGDGRLTPSTPPVLTQPFVVAAMHVADVRRRDGDLERTAEPFGTALTAPAGASAEAARRRRPTACWSGSCPAAWPVFDAALATSLGAIPDGPAETDGIAIGEAAGWGTLAYRLRDGSQSGPLPPSCRPAPACAAPTPPATKRAGPVAGVRGTVHDAHAGPVPPGAPACDRLGRFRRALDEVRRLGSATSTERTAEQTVVARFWGDQPIAQGQRTLRAKAQALRLGPRRHGPVLRRRDDVAGRRHHRLLGRQVHVPVLASVAVGSRSPSRAGLPLLPTPNHPEFPSAHGCARPGSTGLRWPR